VTTATNSLTGRFLTKCGGVTVGPAIPMGKEIPYGSGMAVPKGPASPRFSGIGSLPRKGSPPRPSGSKGVARGGSKIGIGGVIEEIGFITKNL
jgi:hypothetical protein